KLHRSGGSNIRHRGLAGIPDSTVRVEGYFANDVTGPEFGHNTFPAAAARVVDFDDTRKRIVGRGLRIGLRNESRRGADNDSVPNDQYVHRIGREKSRGGSEVARGEADYLYRRY